MKRYSKKEVARAEKEMKQVFDKSYRPPWRPNEKSTHGEWLEYRAITMPFKWQQVIEINEDMAEKMDWAAKFARSLEDRKRWLMQADAYRKAANKMRQGNAIIRADAAKALKELDE